MATVYKREDLVVSVLEKGTLVRLKPRACVSGIDYVMRGGEARIVSVSQEANGETIYHLELIKNGKRRVARRDELVTHREKSQKT
jgi:hypothetical protein